MKKLISIFTLTAFMGAATAGPVPKEQLKPREIVQLTRTQSQSQHVLQVQAGHWVDDYGVVVIVGAIAAAALTVGIIALAND